MYVTLGLDMIGTVTALQLLALSVEHNDFSIVFDGTSSK